MLGGPIRAIRAIPNPFDPIYRYVTTDNDQPADQDNNQFDLNPHIKNIFSVAFKFILFNLYLAYWIPTRIALFCILLLEEIIRYVIVQPFLFLWFRWNRIRDPQAISEANRKVKSFVKTFSYIIVSSSVIYMLFNYRAYLTDNAYHPQSRNNQTSIVEGYQRAWSEIRQEKRALDEQIKQLQAEFKQHKAIYDVNQTAIWAELQHRQIQIEALQRFISEQVKNTIKAQEIDNVMDDKNTVSLENLSRLITDILNAQKTEDMIQTALQTYHQDVLNKADFASIFRHARIVHSLTSHTYSRYPIWKQSILRFFALSPFENTPYEAIKPSTHIGECWSMYGSYGTLGIRLSQPIIIQSISIDYPSSQMMAGNMSKAPRKLELFGINKGANVSLGTAEYDIYDDHAIQTFDMNPTKENESPIVYGIVQLHIKSNWGNPNCTEIYRVRIHGIPPPIIEEKRND